MTDFFAISSKYFYSIKYWKPSKNPNYSNSFWYYLRVKQPVFFANLAFFEKLLTRFRITTTKTVALNRMISEQTARSSKQNKTSDLVTPPGLAGSSKKAPQNSETQNGLRRGLRPYYQVRCFVLLWTSRVLFWYHTIQRYVFGCCNSKSSQKFFKKCQKMPNWQKIQERSQTNVEILFHGLNLTSKTFIGQNKTLIGQNLTCFTGRMQITQ